VDGRCRQRWIFLSAIFALVWNSFAVAQDQPDYRCDLILGDWSGIYIDDGSSWFEGNYQFDGAYDEDGSVIIDFTFLDSEETDRHEGYWLCDNGVLTTGLATRWGGSVLYHYEIIDIDQDSWTYRLISPDPRAPIFRAKRVGARTMNPEIFDSLRN
jgi:hypothetical protein